MRPHPAIFSRPIQTTVLCCLLVGWAHVSFVEAIPLLKGGRDGKGVRFPKNSVLNVFIQPDPKSQGRDQLVKEGVERWKKLLSDRMVTLNVTVGNPPGTGAPANVIRYRWANDGILSNGMELGPGKNDGAAQPFSSQDGSQLIGGDVVLRNALQSESDANKHALRNAGEHELGHVLGFADDSAGSVLKHEQTATPRDLNDRDKKELNSLYGTATSGGAKTPKGQVMKIGGGLGMGFVQYQLDFVAGNPLADSTDPEHVALVTLNIPPALVTSVEAPPGWLGFVPGGTVSIDDPFFSEGFMLDGAGDPPPWDPNSPMAYVAFRASPEEALRDGLPPGVDPALSLDNPTLRFTLFTTPDALEGPIQVWAGGESQTVFGPVIPEPSSLWLLGIGVGWIGFFRPSRPGSRSATHHGTSSARPPSMPRGATRAFR